jgi:hypothetical protein
MTETGRTLYLVRSRDELVEDGCGCPRGLAAHPQPDPRPWEGSGFLFSCLSCRRPFAFARSEWVAEDLTELAIRDLGPGTTTQDAQAWAERMGLLLEHLKPEREYVYLDGTFLPTNAHRVELDGWLARHDLASIPHVEALRNPMVLQEGLANPRYWVDNALPAQG